MIVDRELRQQQLTLVLLLFLLALIAPLVGALSLWPLSAVGGVISAMLLWGALRDESIAGPVVALVLTSVPAMFVGDAPAAGALAGVVFAIALGELLAMMQHTRYATPGHQVRSADLGSVTMHAAVAVCAIVLTMAATFLPEVRALSIGAVVALTWIAVVGQRRRTVLANLPLPPPDPQS